MYSKRRKTSRLKIILGVMMALLFILFGTLGYVRHIENSRNYISQKKINQAQTIVFYRDDCPDCQKVLPKKILMNSLNHQTVFVNLNNQKNRAYITQYNLKEVPTLIENKK